MSSRRRLTRTLCVLFAAGVAAAAWAFPPRDHIPPAAVTDLTVVSVTSSTIALEWTATGDDGHSGTASRYDIRYLPDTLITEENWDTALEADGEPRPEVSGTTQSFTVTGLPHQTTYYVAMKVRDEEQIGEGNWSGLSNVASAVTDAAVPGEWVFDIVDAGVVDHCYLDLVYDPYGLPAIAYSDDANSLIVKFAHSDGSTWDVQIVDSGIDGVALAYDSNGAPSLVYNWSDSQGDPYCSFASWNGSSWDTELIQMSTAANDYPSLAYNAVGEPTVAFGTFRGNDGGEQIPLGLKFARRAGSSWDIEIVDPGNHNAYDYRSLAYDPSGNPAIAYRMADDVNPGRKVNFAHFNGSSWDIETIESGGSSNYVQLAYDSSGNPTIVVSGSGGFHFWAHSGGTWELEFVPAQYTFGLSFSYDSAGTAFASYGNGEDGLTLAKRIGPGNWETETLLPNYGGKTSLAIDPSGRPSIAYQTAGLRFARKLPLSVCDVPADCDDADACTIDDCVGGVCSNTPIVCDDGDACTTDSCSGGACFYDPIDCDDGDACTTDSCSGGACLNDPIDCDDTDACTVDSCSGGVCFNDPVDCDDGDSCTADSCDPASGCANDFPSCGPADGCCGPACDSSNDPDCPSCGAKNDPCSENVDCCSNDCKPNGRCR